MSTVIRPWKDKKTLSVTWYQDETIFLYLIIRCFLHYLLYTLFHGFWFNTELWGILQHGGVYILEHSSGKYSIYCAQPRRCWRNGPEGLQSTSVIRTPPPPVCLADRIDLVSGIKSLKIALKLGNLGQNQVKLNFKDWRPIVGPSHNPEISHCS